MTTFVLLLTSIKLGNADTSKGHPASYRGNK